MSKIRQPSAAAGIPSEVRPWLVAGAFVLLAALVAAGWLLWPRENKLAAVQEIQKQLLATGGKPNRDDITRVMQTIDRMDRRDVRVAYRAAGEEWKRLKQKAIDAYFAASPAERPALLDEQIERLVAYHDLLLAMNPGDRPGGPAYLPRPRRSRDDPPPQRTPTEVKAEQARREIANRFDEALEAHAKARRITLPTFR